MIDKTEEARTIHLLENIPNIWSFNSYLYIGANRDRFHYWEPLKRNGCKVTVVEVDGAECEWLKENHGWLECVYEGDVSDWIWSDLAVLPPWDVLLWSHGPSCLPKELAIDTMETMEGMISELMVYMTPWGEVKGEGYAAPPDGSYWWPKDFEELGCTTATLGSEGVAGSQLLAWKYVS